MDWLTFLSMLGPNSAAAAGLDNPAAGAGAGPMMRPESVLAAPAPPDVPPITGPYTAPLGGGEPPMPPIPSPAATPFAGPGVPYLGGPGGGPVSASAAGAPYMEPGSTASSIGGSMANSPVATGAGVASREAASMTPYEGGGGGEGGGNGSQGGGGGGGQSTASKLQSALRGIQAPARPVAQTVRTPPPPHAPAAVGASQLLNTLISLGMSPQDLTRIVSRGGYGRR